jgi:hypothetical protein
MILTTRVGLLAGAAALTLSGISNARPAGETSNDDMAQRLAAAEAKINAMEAAQNQNWMTEARASEIRGLVQDVLADADTRASLLQSGMTSGYDNGAVIGSADGNWLLRTNIHLQERFVFNYQDDAGFDVESDRYGFEPARVQFFLSGHVVDPSWYYNIRINVGAEDQQGLIFGYIGKDFGNGLKIQMGAMQSQLLREDIVATQYQLAVERSSVNYLFNAGYVDALQASWEGDKFRVFGQLSDGASTANTVWSAYDTEYAITGRAEFLLSGNWNQFNDFTSPRGSEGGIMIGGAVHWQKGEDGGFAQDVDSFTITGDVSWEGNGFNLFGAVMYSDTDAADNNPLGVVVHGGWYFNDTTELFGRVEWTDFDVPGSDDFGMVTVGVNKYFASHNNKMTLDVGYAWETITFGSSVTGIRPDFGDEDGQLVVRYQWQILF